MFIHLWRFSFFYLNRIRPEGQLSNGQVTLEVNHKCLGRYKKLEIKNIDLESNLSDEAFRVLTYRILTSSGIDL